MPSSSDAFVSAVNHVISICKDAEKGFHGAAKAIESPVLKDTFEKYSAQRAGFVRELQEAVRSFGDQPEDPAGVAGSLHSGWMAVKGALTGHSEHQILEETERGEDLSVKSYREALANQLPDAINSLLQRQYEQVLQAHNQIRSLRDATRAA
jgi:uncharacterized protein (TIGR02284 family)